MSTSAPGSSAPPIVMDVQNVSKRYNLYRSTGHRLAGMLGLAKPLDVKSALRDVSFSVRKGEMIGLIGGNGAGKSTLLKLVAGATAASSGKITRSGRIAALLELGAGFHPEWTGRQNVEYYLRLQGLRRAEVQALLPQIESFADIGAYFDQPIRTCSTGMAMRVSFAAAALLPCETLIIDEALVVGDNRFAHKCFQHIAQLREQGITIFLVTHRLDLVTQLCSRALYLQHGQLVFDGSPDEALLLYYQQYTTSPNADDGRISAKIEKPDTEYGSREANIRAVRLSDNRLRSGAKAIVSVDLHFAKACNHPVLMFALKTTEGVLLYQTNTDELKASIGAAAADSHVTVEIATPLPFATMSVFVNLALTEQRSDGLHVLHAKASCVEIEVDGPPGLLGLVDVGAAMTLIGTEMVP